MALGIDMLMPVELLPEEGAEVSPVQTGNGAPSRDELVSYYLKLTGESPLCFRVSADGIDVGIETGRAVPMQHARLSLNGSEEKMPWFDLSPSSTTLDLGGVAADEHDADFIVDGKGEAEDCLRAFLTRFTPSLENATRGFAGTAVPLLRWWKSEAEGGTSVDVQFCGVLLADADLLASLREAGGTFDESLGLVLEQAEVEGRGLREVAASLAVMGVVLAGSAPTAEAGLLGNIFKSKNGGKGNVETVAAHHYQAPARVDQNLLAVSDAGDAEVVIDVEKQRAYLLIDGQIAIDSPVSTARSGKFTPRGEFKITQRVRTGKTSTIYGCELPCWMRLDQSAIGMHVGDLPGYPASAGCVRLPSNIAPLIFENTKSGTTVRVVDSWQGPNMMVASL